jgi:hypothetical protein
MRHEACQFFGARDATELRRHLRGLRDLGLLVTEAGRLAQRVQAPDGTAFRAYVVKGSAADVPRIKRHRRPRIVRF